VVTFKRRLCAGIRQNRLLLLLKRGAHRPVETQSIGIVGSAPKSGAFLARGSGPPIHARHPNDNAVSSLSGAVAVTGEFSNAGMIVYRQPRRCGGAGPTVISGSAVSTIWRKAKGNLV
jgi:hypothetical protein